MKTALLMSALVSTHLAHGLFGDVGQRAAGRVAARRAAVQIAEERAERAAIVQEDREAFIALVKIAGFCLYGCGYATVSTVCFLPRLVLNPQAQWQALSSGETFEVVGAVGIVAAICAGAYYLGKRNNRTREFVYG